MGQAQRSGREPGGSPGGPSLPWPGREKPRARPKVPSSGSSPSTSGSPASASRTSSKASGPTTGTPIPSPAAPTATPAWVETTPRRIWRARSSRLCTSPAKRRTSKGARVGITIALAAMAAVRREPRLVRGDAGPARAEELADLGGQVCGAHDVHGRQGVRGVGGTASTRNDRHSLGRAARRPLVPCPAPAARSPSWRSS